MTTTTRTVNLPDAEPVDIAVGDYGDGQPFLLAHGGGSPDTVTGFGELLITAPVLSGVMGWPAAIMSRRLSFHNPGPFRIDPTALPPGAQAIATGNRAALATYAGTAMSDPTLAGRLAHLELPSLVLWGRQRPDRRPRLRPRLRRRHSSPPASSS